MDFTDVPLGRSVGAGASAYVVGYLATYLAVGSRAEALLRGMTFDLRYGGAFVPLLELVEPTPETWKVVGWFFHSAQWSKLVNPQPASGEILRVNLAASAGVEYLYLVAPCALFVAGYAAARTGATYGIRGEDYAGASVALGYLPFAVAGGLLYTVGRPAVGPDLLTTAFVVGVGYPVFFGWLGGFAARMRDRVAGSSERTDPGV